MTANLFLDEKGHFVAEQPIDGGAAIRVKIIADSITDGACRLLTWTWTYPRMIHAEIMTHRALARNAASSRAIPMPTLRDRVEKSPAMHVHWGAAQKGMQAFNEIDDKTAAQRWWLNACRDAVAWHHNGEALGLAKQVVNRVIEPWMTIETIVSGTEWPNFFALRDHKDAEPSFRVLARLAWTAFHEHMPTAIKLGGWHLPFVYSEDMQEAKSTEELIKLAVGRCARVSYLTHEGTRDRQADYDLHDRLVRAAQTGNDPLHASPLEHACKAVGRYTGGPASVSPEYRTGPEYHSGPFVGWQQYRKTFANENGPLVKTRCAICGCWNGDHVRGCPEHKVEA